MDAVKRGDMEAATRMVREAAARAMPRTKVVDGDALPKIVYHGTGSGGFTEFNTSDGGVWMAESSLYSDQYKNAWGAERKQTYELFADITNPIDLREIGADSFVAEYRDPETGEWVPTDALRQLAEASGVPVERLLLFAEEHAEVALDGEHPYSIIRTKEFQDSLKQQGYDGIVQTEGGGTETYCAFSPEQVKSAAPVTYDDAGNVIPLSQRFNAANPDIRFSVDMHETLDIEAWGDLQRKVQIVHRDNPPWVYKKGLKTREAKNEISKLAIANIQAQENYIKLSNETVPALKIGEVLFKIPIRNLFHGADRRLAANGQAAAAIGDILNASIEIPNVPYPWHYRLAEIDFGHTSFVLVAAKESSGTDEVVEVQSLYSLNVKASDAARELNHTNTTRPTTDILSNLRDAWQGVFLSNLVKHNLEKQTAASRQGGTVNSIASTLATSRESTAEYIDSKGTKRTLHVEEGNRKYGMVKVRRKHCVDFGTAWNGGFTLDELNRYENEILQNGKKKFDRKTGRRTITWKSPEGVTFTISTFVTGKGRNAREILNTIYTDRTQKETKRLATQFGGKTSSVKQVAAYDTKYSASRQGGNGELFSAAGGAASPDELRRAVARANAARFSSAKRPNYNDYRDDKPGAQKGAQESARSIADDYDNPYPAIRNLSDDELVASALAVRMALGKSPQERMATPGRQSNRTGENAGSLETHWRGRFANHHARRHIAKNNGRN